VDKVLVLHHLSGHAARIKALVETLRKESGNEICVVALNNAGQELKRENIEYKTLSDYIAREDYTGIEAKARAFVKALGTSQIDGGRTLTKLLEYDNTSLWWFVEADVCVYHIEPLLHLMNNLQQIMNLEKPAKILAINDESSLVKVIAAMARARNIPIELLPPKLSLRAHIIASSLLMKLKPLATPYIWLLRDFLRQNWLRLSSMGKATSRRNTVGRKIFLASMRREQKGVDPITGKETREDYILGPVVRKLDENGEDNLVFLHKFTSPLQVCLPGELIRGEKVIYRPWEYYKTLQIQRRIQKEKKRLARKWLELAGTEAFRALFKYKNISLWDISREEFRLMFQLSLPAVVRNIELAERIMAVEEPDILVLASENSRDNKALVIAANLKGIPVLAVQHGTAVASGDYVIDWRCSTEELNGSPPKSSIFPTKVAVYGEDTLNTFVNEIGYPYKERLIITGQPRYDILTRADEIFDKEKFCACFGIDPNKKMVLIASQDFNVAGNKEAFFRIVLKALKDIPEIQVVIKPKFNEKEEWHRKLAEEVGVRAVVLPTNANTNEALYASGVLITFYSTVAVEAMILERPVVTVNLTDAPDPMPFAESGAAIGVYKAEDIVPAIKDALESAEAGRRLEQGRKTYLSRQFHKLDSQATQRVVDLIYSMIENPEEH